MAAPLAQPADVAAIWHSPLTEDETTQVTTLIAVASAKLRHACPFDIDERVSLFDTDPAAVTALDPSVVANVVATIVKRFLVNPTGYASTSESTGPYSRSGTFVNRYDKTGSDVRGAIEVIESDIEELRPAVPAEIPSSFQVGMPCPQVVIHRPGIGPNGLPLGPAVIPDFAPGTGAE